MAGMRSFGMLQRSAKAVKCDIQDILQSGNYYVTEEIAKELSVIENAIQHLTLDDTFLSTSEEWQTKPGNFSAAQTNQQLSNAMAAINHTGSKLREYKSCLSNQSVSGKQENQLREIHQWAVSSLKENQKELQGLTTDAADRIKQFGDTIGVTDRYTGYRQNLTRGTRDPFRLQTSWMDKTGEIGRMNNLTRSHTTIGGPCQEPKPLARSMTTLGDASRFGAVPHSNIGALKKQVGFDTGSQPMRVARGYRTIDSLYPSGREAMPCGVPRGSDAINEVKHLNARNAADMCNKMENGGYRSAQPRQPYENMSVQEQAGINTTFPGRTEYMQRYKAPDTDQPTCDFLINPTPNFAIYGRPMQQAVYIPSFTEYQTRYDWPDAEKIVKLPWLRN